VLDGIGTAMEAEARKHKLELAEEVSEHRNGMGIIRTRAVIEE